MTKQTMNPAAQGRQAFYLKLGRESNPFNQGTPDYDAWKRGYDAAQDEAAEDWAYEQVRKNR